MSREHGEASLKDRLFRTAAALVVVGAGVVSVPARTSKAECLLPEPPKNLRVYAPAGVTSITKTRPDGATETTYYPSAPTILLWDAVPGADGYHVRLDDPTTKGEGKEPDIVVNDVTTDWIGIPDLANPTTYSWWLHAKNPCGVSAAVGSTFGIARATSVQNPNIPRQ